MFFLYNIMGWSINELGLADEFVELVKLIEILVYPFIQPFIG